MVDPDESTEEEFFEAIGSAIIAWQHVESRCAYLFAYLLWAYGFGPIAIFYHIKNFSTRIEIMNIAARFTFEHRPNARLKTRWVTLSERLTKASALRNRLAHFEMDESMTPNGWKFSLQPPSSDWSQLNPDQPDNTNGH